MTNENAGEGSEDQQGGGSPPAGQESAPRKRHRRGLIIGLSAGGAAVVAAAVVVTLSMTVWAELDRDDYELAASFTDTTTGFFEVIVVDTDTALRTTRDSNSAEEVDDAVDAAHADEADFADHLDKLSELPAVTDDPEIGKLFKEFETAYGTNRDTLMEGADAAIPFGEYFRACHGNQSEPISQMRVGMSSADLGPILKEFDNSQAPCIEELQKLAKSDYEWFREPAQALLERWQPVRDGVEQSGQAGITEDQGDLQAARDVLQKARDDYATAQSELDGSFRYVSDEIKSHDSSEKLLDALKRKIEQFES